MFHDMQTLLNSKSVALHELDSDHLLKDLLSVFTIIDYFHCFRPNSEHEEAAHGRNSSDFDR